MGAAQAPFTYALDEESAMTEPPATIDVDGDVRTLCPYCSPVYYPPSDMADLHRIWHARYARLESSPPLRGDYVSA